jgi:hypothetical protein
MIDSKTLKNKITKQTIYMVDDNVNDMNDVNGNRTSNRQTNLYSKIKSYVLKQNKVTT